MVIAIMVMACFQQTEAIPHNGKLTRAECARLLDRQIANYHGQYDEVLIP